MIKGEIDLKVNVLGAVYSVVESNKINNPRLKYCDGYCDNTIRECVIDNCDDADLMAKSNLKEFKKKVIRHELIHAFLFESGLAENSEWANNEELVDWIAFQFPKMMKAFQEADCL